MSANEASLQPVETSVTRPDWPVNIIVIVARLAVSGAIWAYAVTALDDPRIGNQDVRVFSLRLGLWLYVAEMLYDLYRGTRYVTPPGFAGTVKLAARESAKTAFFAVWTTPLSLAVRWVLLVLFSSLAMRLPASCAWLAYGAAFLPTFIIRWFRRWLARRFAAPQFPLIRGTHLGSYLEAVARAAVLRSALLMNAQTRSPATNLASRESSVFEQMEARTVPWGGVDLPLVRMDPHYVLLGVAGSGKTLAIRMLMRAALANPGARPHARAVVYDAKREFFPILRGMGVPPEFIVLLNPVDARSSAWDLSEDISTKDDARNIAIALIPDTGAHGRENAFFVQAVQALLTAVLWGMKKRRREAWSLLDVLRAFASADTLRDFLCADADGRDTYNRYFTSAPETVGGIISTIDTKLISPYESVAHLWARCERRVSLRTWATDPRPSILVLGTDENRASVDRINQAMFQRIVQLLSAKPDIAQDPDRHSDTTWFFLDELRFAGELPMIGHLISLGRSKGVRAVLALQDVDGVYAEYGENKANELLALCGNIAIFRLISPKTRDFAAKLFGEYEAWERDYSFSVSGGRFPTTQFGMIGRLTWGDSETRSTHAKIVKRESILPAEFFNLSKAGVQSGIPGFFATPEMGAWRGPIPWSHIAQHLSEKEPGATAFLPRPPSDYESPLADGGWSESLFADSHQAKTPPTPAQPPRPSSGRRGRLPD